MRIKLLFIVAFCTSSFVGCTVNVNDAPKGEKFNSPIIKNLINDSNITGAGEVSLLGVDTDENPLLAKPKVAKINIYRHIDSDGDFHESSSVHIVVEKSKFIENRKLFSIND